MKKIYIPILAVLITFTVASCTFQSKQPSSLPPTQGSSYVGPFLNLSVPEGWTASTINNEEGENALQLQDNAKEISLNIAPINIPSSAGVGELTNRHDAAKEVKFFVSDIMTLTIDKVEFKYYVSQNTEEDPITTEAIGVVNQTPFLLTLIGADVDEDTIKPLIASIVFTI
jgi:hypothetical protein